MKWYYHAARFNTQGSVYASRDNYMDLDPTYKDALGRPLIRLTYNPPDNEFKMSAYLLQKLEGVIKAMNPTHYEMHPRPKTFTVVPYQSTHNTGGTMMGADPKSSVVNRYLQAWDAHNLFIQGASVFPQQHGYNPTGTVGALAYWSARAITRAISKSGTAGTLEHDQRWTPVCRKEHAQTKNRHGGIRQSKKPGAFSGGAAAVVLAVATPTVAADATRGKVVFQTCAACHSDKPDAIGPSLRGVYGRKSAALQDFRYSNAMTGANLTWDDANLKAYIKDPQAKVKGNRMPFGGLSSDADIDDVIAYLKDYK